MYYLDTAVVLTLFIDEPTSAPIEEWLLSKRQTVRHQGPQSIAQTLKASHC